MSLLVLSANPLPEGEEISAFDPPEDCPLTSKWIRLFGDHNNAQHRDVKQHPHSFSDKDIDVSWGFLRVNRPTFGSELVVTSSIASIAFQVTRKPTIRTGTVLIPKAKAKEEDTSQNNENEMDIQIKGKGDNGGQMIMKDEADNNSQNDLNLTFNSSTRNCEINDNSTESKRMEKLRLLLRRITTLCRTVIWKPASWCL